MARHCPKPKRKRDATWFREKVLLVKAQGNGKVLNEEELEFLADPGIAEAKAVLMANFSSYRSNVLSEYLIESQNTSVQDTNSSTQQDALILSVFEQLSNQEKEAKNIDTEIALEKKVKELDNIVCKMGQSAQTVHMLMKLQVFYDNNLKQALGFQNPFYLKKAQQIRPMLYDGNVIAKETNVISIDDSEETLMLEEESRSKMFLKQSDSMVLNMLNRLSEDFGKRFVPQRELFDEQALHPNTDQSASSPVIIDAPRELPKKGNGDVNTFVKGNSSVVMNDSMNYVEMCNKCLELEAELIKQHNMEKVFVITALKNDLRKFKGKDIVDNAAQASNATTIAPGMYNINPVTLAPKDKNNSETYIYYLKHTMEQAAILKEIVEQAYSLNPLDSASYSACNIPKVTNRPLLSSTGVNPSTSASGSKPSGNTKNDRISRTPSSNEKNKVEVQSRKVKSKLNKQNSDSKNVCNEHVKHPVKGAKALCSVCNECLFDANHAMCLIDHVNSMNVRAKSASKKNKKRKEWKPTGKVFNSVGYKWKPTGRTFTLVGNACPLTRRPKVPKSIQNSKPKVVRSMTANRMKPGTSRGFDTSVAPSSSSLIDCRLSKLFCGIWTPDAPST
ncbi:hypothetical protein Tco_0127301 [Tanacetum coccineum]